MTRSRIARTHPNRRVVSILLLSILGTGSISPLRAATGEDLIAAAQLGDLAAVEKLLDGGVDVDSRSRYGATALFFAVDKANAEMVSLLLEHRADVDVVDRFYSASPLDWVLFKAEESPPHRDILFQLLVAKPKKTAAVLALAARTGDVELADTVLALEQASGSELRTAATTAEAAGHAELAARLSKLAAAAPKEKTIEISLAELETYVGDFKNDEVGLEIKVFLDGDVLKAQATNQPALSLTATGKRAFRAVEFDGISIAFRGRGGTVEGLVLNQAGVELDFPKATAAADDDGGKLETAPLPKAVRTAARPWPSFRGPAASGNGDGQGAPTAWDGAAGENVLWKTPIPGIGLSSPIVWGDRVFVTTAISSAEDETFRIGLYGDVDAVDDASSHRWKVYALDRKSGAILWERTAAEGVPQVQRHTKSSHANPTPVTDGRYVVAHFGSEGIFCYTIDGELQWHVEVPKLVSGWFYDPTYEWGFASSPMLHEGLVIVQTDIQKGSYIAAYDLESGKLRWKTARDEIPTWATPNVLLTKDGAEVVTNGTTIRGYDAGSGEELWTLGPNSEVTVGTPVVGDGVAYVTGGYPPVRPIYAIKAGGRGDLTLRKGKTSSNSIAWSTTRGGTYIPTPLLYKGILYMTHNNGRLTAHDATTGEQIYRARVGTSDSFAGSPVAADGKLYFTNEEGRTYVVRSGPAYEEIGRSELGEIVMTTPAISDGVMILRGLKHVWALADGPLDGDRGGDG